MTTLQGIAASPGIAIGPIHVVDPEEIEVQDGNLAKSAVSGEKERFRTAIRESLDEVRELREKIALE
ncbi:MAG: phosphoenolpyruvate--protein phosphotransferase, partial [Candidatus Eisenbacteria bacterium]